MVDSKFEILLLDAANTIIHKPDLWSVFLTVLKENNIEVDELELKRKHKILSEIIHFPDVTSIDFYKTFNYEVLLSMGIVADEHLLNAIFSNCSYLPWRAFEDSFALKKLPIKKAILSNFNSSLNGKIKNIFGDDVFDTIISSEEEKIGKPDIRFYKRALEILDIDPKKILYIGDSLKLDVIPAQSIGIETWLIDRDRNFMQFKNRLDSLFELDKLIK